MRPWWKNKVAQLRRERWRDQVASGKGPVVSMVDLSKPRRGEAPFLVSALGFQPIPGMNSLGCQPWGRLVIEASRWETEGKKIVESLLSVRSRAELLAVDSGRFIASQDECGKGFYDRNNSVSVGWDEASTVEFHPRKGANQSAVGVWELGRSVALEVREGRVRLLISVAGFTAMVDELLHYSAIVSSHKLPQALVLLADQGAVLREPE